MSTFEDNLGFYAIFDSAFPKAPLKKEDHSSQSDLSEIKKALYTKASWNK